MISLAESTPKSCSCCTWKQVISFLPEIYTKCQKSYLKWSFAIFNTEHLGVLSRIRSRVKISHYIQPINLSSVLVKLSRQIEKSWLNSFLCFFFLGVGIASVGAIGIGINLFAIWKLSFGQDKAERHCFHHLLLSLSICDLTHIIFNFICFALPHLSEAYRENVLLYTIPFLIPLAQMSLSCSSFITVVSDFMLFHICIWLKIRFQERIRNFLPV